MSYHIIRSELSASAAGGWSFLKALISVMSALHNWIIDAERYRILLSLHLSPSHFNVFHLGTLSLTHSSLQTQLPFLDLFPFFGFFLWFVSILVFLKVYITYNTTHSATYMMHRHFILNSSWSSIALSDFKKRQERKSSKQFCSYGTFRRIFHYSLLVRQSVWTLSNKEKMVTTLKGITGLERFWLVGPIHTKIKTVWMLHWPFHGEHSQVTVTISGLKASICRTVCDYNIFHFIYFL